MSQNQRNNNGNGGNNIENGNGSGSVQVPWGTKAGYVGTGILIGLVIYPFVRKAVSKLQPKMDRIFDDLTGKAEEMAERTSDLLARAKEKLRAAEEEDETHHPHAHPRGDDEAQPNGAP